jgi:hypothetical protein
MEQGLRSYRAGQWRGLSDWDSLNTYEFDSREIVNAEFTLRGKRCDLAIRS